MTSIEPRHDKNADGVGRGSYLDVTPADLINTADQYADLQRQAAAIGPHAVGAVNQVIATHGAIGYPVAVGVVMGLAPRQAQVEMKAAQFGVYSARFTEHAAAYQGQDSAGAAGYQQALFSV